MSQQMKRAIFKASQHPTERAAMRRTLKHVAQLKRQIVCAGCAKGYTTLRRVPGTRVYACGDHAPKGVPTNAMRQRIIDELARLFEPYVAQQIAIADIPGVDDLMDLLHADAFWYVIRAHNLAIKAAEAKAKVEPIVDEVAA